MTDSQFDWQRARIERFQVKWLDNLGLGFWKIKLQFYREPMDVKEGANCTGKADVMWEYMQATLSFYLPGMLDMSDAEAERLFVHECCHVLVHEMREWCQTENLDSDVSAKCMKHEERVVCAMTAAFIWTFKAGQESSAKCEPS